MPEYLPYHKPTPAQVETVPRCIVVELLGPDFASATPEAIADGILDWQLIWGHPLAHQATPCPEYGRYAFVERVPAGCRCTLCGQPERWIWGQYTRKETR